MELGRAFSYIFEDPEWTSKLLIAAVISFGAIITTPLLIGLVGWAALLGYQVELIRNVRDGQPLPLPRWDDYGEKIRKGGSVMAAYFVYLLPVLVLSCCFSGLSLLGGGGDGGFVMGTLSLAVSCCLMPLLLVYSLAIWPMLTLGTARFADEGNIGVFFQFGDLFNTLYRRLGVTLTWMVFAFVANFVIGIIGSIPCIGWVAAPPLMIAVQGHLAAQLAAQVEDAPRSLKPKRTGYM